MTDEEALELAINGRPEGFRTIYLRYSSYLYTLALRVLRQSGPAEDAVQEAFLSAFRHLDRFRGESRLKTWLYSILVRSALRLQEKGRREVPGEDVDREVHPEDEQRVNNKLDVREILDQLAPKDRAILVMAYWDDLSCREIAEIFDLTENHVKVLLFRARKKFAGFWGKGEAHEV
jgi:RNA polymerase sigma-70 factor (ECF subfamily)